ncbi:MAG: DUF4278 domain-containing protein [Xenococcaceae cyanobacterium MO_207.B15]|nr:DUF4278 domain-containing protein [Xenococcaceae cyanobacterium MO_207.B15]
MELHFLGQTYATANHRVPTIATENTAHFLGQSYTVRRPIQSFKPQLGLRKYRGISYGAE